MIWPAPVGQHVLVRTGARRGVLLLLAAAGVGTLALLTVAGGDGDDRAVTPAVVLAVDERGAPVPGARATVLTDDVLVDPGDDGRAGAGDGGRVELALASPALVRVEAAGRAARVVAAAPGQVSHALLTGEGERTLSVRIGGDVMFGRRFLDADEDGRTDDGLLDPSSDATAHAALLTHVAPLLGDADITVVNLETPLLDDPYLDPTAPRPARWHPTKEFAFASSTVSAAALLDSGVDVVSLGNNHVLDALDAGLRQTIGALDEAGMPYFGAGLTEDEAWRPALVERKGQRLAVLGCTTITGREHPISYVAEDGHGGAARCTEDRLRHEVAAARQDADVVLVMIHGGEEYEARQTDLVRDLSEVARAAGAAMVVDGHPHVVGGSTVSAGGDLFVETTGNLLFDQDVWPTFLSYVVRADVRDGAVVAAVADPIQLEDYVPRPVVGAVAGASARRAAGLVEPGSAALLGQGALSPPLLPLQEARALELPAQQTVRLPDGWWPVEDVPGLRVGEDLLWSGSFEDMDTDPSTEGAHHWSLSPVGARLTASAACTGAVGVELRRGGLSEADTVLTPDHRQLVDGGQELSLLVDVRDAGEGAVVELRTYEDTRGGSSGGASAPIPPSAGEDGCTTVRLDLTTPPGTVAVQPYVRLGPPGDVQTSVRLSVDDIRLVAWAEERSRSGSPRWDHVRATAATELDLVAVRGTPWP